MALPRSPEVRLVKAAKIIRSLLQYGEHSGKCTNIMKNGERDRLKSCTKHISASRRREREATRFLSVITGI
jgi:hypothetical protein